MPRQGYPGPTSDVLFATSPIQIEVRNSSPHHFQSTPHLQRPHYQSLSRRPPTGEESSPPIQNLQLALPIVISAQSHPSFPIPKVPNPLQTNGTVTRDYGNVGLLANGCTLIGSNTTAETRECKVREDGGGEAREAPGASAEEENH